MVGQFAIAFGLPTAEWLFPRESWPWTLCRETALTVAGRPNYLGAELQRVYASPETGPLCCLAVASLSRLAKVNYADAFATRGLAVLDRHAFLRDCRPLLDQRTVCGQCAHRIAEALCVLDEDDAQLLGRELLKDDAGILEAAIGEFRRDRTRPVEAALSDALAAAWEAGLRRRIEKALEWRLPDDTFRLDR